MKLRNLQPRLREPVRGVDVISARQQEGLITFSRDEEIDSDYLELIQEQVELMIWSPNDETFNTVVNLALLYPERKEELGLDEDTFQSLLRKVQRDVAQGSRQLTMQEFIQYENTHFRHPPSPREVKRIQAAHLGDLAMAFPEHRGELGVNENIWQECVTGMQEERGRSSWNYYLKYAEAALKLFPDRLDQLGLDNEVFEQLNSWLQERKSNRWFYLNMVSTLLLLFPDKKIEIGIDAQFIDNAQKAVARFKDDHDYANFARGVHLLSIFTADEIKLDIYGLHLQHRTSVKQEQSLPARKLVA